MAYTEISNFRYGLDSRRSVLTSEPGVLEVLRNGHINQGGEIEKRKAFTRIVLPSNTFGLQSDGTDLWVFGSVTPPAMPAGVRYQRLSVAGLQMVDVKWTTIHDGKLFVIAGFSDGENYYFYDGVEVTDFKQGIFTAFDVADPANMAQKVAQYIDALQSGSFNATQLGGVDDHKVDVVGTQGEDYTLTQIYTSSHGVLNVSNTAVAVAPRPGTPAVATFRILGGTVSAGVNQILKVEIGPVGGALVEITNGAVDYVTDNPGTAIAVAASINTKSSTPDYTAVASLDTVQIYSLTTASPMPNGYEVRVTVAGNVCVDDCSFFLILNAGGTSFTLVGMYANGVQIMSALFLSGVNNVFPGTSTTMTAFAAAIAADINANTTAGLAHGYVATSIGHYIRISRKVTSNQLGDIIVNPQITGDGSVGGGITPGPGGPLQAVVPSALTTSLETSGSIARGQSGPAVCSPAGGSGSYPGFLWQEEATGSANGITILSPNTQSTAFYCNAVSIGATLSGRFVCTVTDSNGTKKISNTITVTFIGERFDTGNF